MKEEKASQELDSGFYIQCSTQLFMQFSYNVTVLTSRIRTQIFFLKHKNV
jgi:hypothetical protein